jgi:hypothetical protein
MRRFSTFSRRIKKPRDWLAEKGGFEPPSLFQDSMGGIRPEFGALFVPKKSTPAEEKVFAKDSALFGSLRFPWFATLMRRIW